MNRAKNKRKKFVSELHNLYGFPRSDDILIFQANSFLIKSSDEFTEGHFDASIIFSSQAVELALITEICRIENESGKLENFKKSIKRPLTLGDFLKKLKEEKYSNILSLELLDEAVKLNRYRIVYAHTINLLIYGIKTLKNQKEIRQKYEDEFFDKINIENIPYKGSIPFFGKKISALDKKFEQISNETAPLKIFEGLANKKVIETLEKERGERIIRELEEQFSSWKNFLFFLLKLMVNGVRPDIKYLDAQHVLKITFENIS
jgi:HEPN domain-containing protein